LRSPTPERGIGVGFLRHGGFFSFFSGRQTTSPLAAKRTCWVGLSPVERLCKLGWLRLFAVGQQTLGAGQEASATACLDALGRFLADAAELGGGPDCRYRPARRRRGGNRFIAIAHKATNAVRFAGIRRAPQRADHSHLQRAATLGKASCRALGRSPRNALQGIARHVELSLSPTSRPASGTDFRPCRRASACGRRVLRRREASVSEPRPISFPSPCGPPHHVRGDDRVVEGFRNLEILAGSRLFNAVKAFPRRPCR